MSVLEAAGGVFFQELGPAPPGSPGLQHDDRCTTASALTSSTDKVGGIPL